MTIDLTPRQEQAIHAAILAGKFRSVEEFIDSALATLSPSEPVREARENLHQFLMRSPLRGANLDLERVRDYPRQVDLE